MFPSLLQHYSLNIMSELLSSTLVLELEKSLCLTFLTTLHLRLYSWHWFLMMGMAHSPIFPCLRGRTPSIGASRCVPCLDHESSWISLKRASLKQVMSNNYGTITRKMRRLCFSSNNLYMRSCSHIL